MGKGDPATDEAAARAVVSDPRWFPEDYDPLRDAFSFVRTDREMLARQVFLDQRWNRSALERRSVARAAIAAAMPSSPSPGLNFIWHTSFCCSTLIAEALDRPGANLALREPLALVPVADARRAELHSGKPMPERVSELCFRLLARGGGQDRCVTVKPSNFANILVRDAARLTAGKALFLYSDLESFLISVAKSGVQLRKYARRLFGNIAGDGGGPLAWSPQEIFTMSDLEIAALAWHLQIAEFRRGWALLGPARAASLDCEAFLADPAATLAKLDGFFGLGLGSEHIGQVIAGPLLKRHAKQPQHPFDAQRRREENAAVRGFLKDDLERIVEWSYKACPGTPRGAPLPGALVPSGNGSEP